MKRIIPTFEQYLFEDPDTAHKSGRELNFMSGGAMPFGYINGVMTIGKKGTIHYSKMRGLERSMYKSSGRVWTKEEVISFWNLDRPLADVINDLNDVLAPLKIKIEGNWLVERAIYVSLRRAYTTAEATSLERLDNVIKNAPNGSNDSYTIIWDDIFKYFVEKNAI